MNSEKAIRTIFSSLLVLFLIHMIIKNLLGEKVLKGNAIKIYKLGTNTPILVNTIKYPNAIANNSNNNNNNNGNGNNGNGNRIKNRSNSGRNTNKNSNRNGNKNNNDNHLTNYEKEKQNLLNYIIQNSQNTEEPNSFKPNNFFNNSGPSEPEQSDFTIAQTDLSTYFQNNETQHPKKKITPPNCSQGNYDNMSKTIISKSKGGPGSADSIDPILLATYSDETVMNGGRFGSVTGFDGLTGAFASAY